MLFAAINIHDKFVHEIYFEESTVTVHTTNASVHNFQGIVERDLRNNTQNGQMPHTIKFAIIFYQRWKIVIYQHWKSVNAVMVVIVNACIHDVCCKSRTCFHHFCRVYARQMCIERSNTTTHQWRCSPFKCIECRLSTCHCQTCNIIKP